AETRDLVQISDASALVKVVEKVLAENPDAVESFRSGEQKVVGFLVGQVMRATQGRADPKMVNELLRRELAS
ncbi:MAG: Asp-tRNA(Asn)/Glu-tRNA(Gln) amidotransferase GatCAB subunit B, partial [Acidimicrobiia bacterium]